MTRRLNKNSLPLFFLFLAVHLFLLLQPVKTESTASEDFCTVKRYDKKVLFISQQSPGRYLFFGDDDLYYSVALPFNGTSFKQVPAGPNKLVGESGPLKGLQSVAAYLAGQSEPVPFAAVLFIDPQAQPNLVLQFLGRQVWFVDTKTGASTLLNWPNSSCPAQVGALLNMAAQPHVLFDQHAYAYSLSVNLTDGGNDDENPPQIVCGPRSKVAIFPESLDYLGASAMLAVESQQGNHICQPEELLVLRWMRSKAVCRSCLQSSFNLVTPFCEQQSQLPSRWSLFNCADPSQAAASPGWLVALYAGTAIVLVFAIAYTAYLLAKRVFHNTKKEILSSGLASSKIG